MPLTTRYMAAKHLARNAGDLAHEFFAHRHFMFAGHSTAPDFGERSIGTIRTLLRTKLAAAFPGDAIIDARVADSAYSALERAWIIEPISGTENFVRGIPCYGISMTYLEGDRCEAGVVYDPEHDELFHARRGNGAWCEHAGTETPLEVAHCEALEGAMICVARDERHPDPGDLVIRHELMDLGASVRALGTQAIELAYVAAGRCDGFVGLHVNLQHLRIGMLLVEEAGGCVARRAPGEGARAESPFVVSAPGIARPLADAANLWMGHRAAELRPARDTRPH
jgi:myo-inositol-1(or 4)-monophosphatase